jgi:hypothetical protein
MFKTIKSLCAAAALALGLAAAPAANAAYVLTFQGVTFTIDVVNAADGIFTLRIQNLLSTTDDDWADVTHIKALGFKGIGDDFTAVGSTIAPGTATPNNFELNAGGCSVGAGDDKLCFVFNPLYAASDDMTFTIDLAGSLDIGDGSPHLKVNFTNAAGTKIGSLLSLDIPLVSSSSSSSSGTTSSSSSSTSSGTISEPGTSALALLGLGLLGIALRSRRRAQQAA